MVISTSPLIQLVQHTQPDGRLPLTNLAQWLSTGTAALSGEVVLTLTLLLVILLDAVQGARRVQEKKGLVALAAFGILLAGGWDVWSLYRMELLGPEQAGAQPFRFSHFGGLLVLDSLAKLLQLLLNVVGLYALGLLAAASPLGQPRARQSEWLVLLLGMLLGGRLLAGTEHGVLAAISVELLSLCGYALTAYRRGALLTAEAAIKYLIYGAVSGALLIYGLSLLYGLTGTLHLGAMLQGPELEGLSKLSLYVLWGLVLGGLAYKVTSVPFHFWAPDVYQTLPPGLGGLFSTLPKVAAFGLFIRLGALLADTASQDVLIVLLALLATGSMLVGNLAALNQNSVRRLLAYSGIAHTGYLLMALSVLGWRDVQGLVLFYLLIYSLMNLLAFAAVAVLHQRWGTDDLRLWSGRGREAPRETGVLGVALLSLTGLPPTAGFIAKLYIFLPVFRAWQDSNNPVYLGLLVLALISTVLSLYYYLRVLVALVQGLPGSPEPGESAAPDHTPQPLVGESGLNILLSLSAMLLLVLGLFGYDRLLDTFRSFLEGFTNY